MELSFHGMTIDQIFDCFIHSKILNENHVNFLLNEIKHLGQLELFWRKMLIYALSEYYYDNVLFFMKQHCEHFHKMNQDMQIYKIKYLRDLIQKPKRIHISEKMKKYIGILENFKLTRRNETKLWKMLPKDELHVIYQNFLHFDDIEIRILCFSIAYCKHNGHL